MLRLFSLNNRIFGTKQILQTIREKTIIVELRNACSHLGTLKLSGAMARLLQGAGVKEGTEEPWPCLSQGTLLFSRVRDMHCEFNNSWVILKSDCNQKRLQVVVISYQWKTLYSVLEL